jgi:cytidine deaminase
MAMYEIGRNERKLLCVSAKAIERAYVLWGFKVGAAVIASDGQAYEGCNVESWISGLGICAERCAINHAVLHGNTSIKEIAIVMEVNAHEVPRPCGACLQYISDFAVNPKIKIVTARVNKREVLYDTVTIRSLEEYLPLPHKK